MNEWGYKNNRTKNDKILTHYLFPDEILKYIFCNLSFIVMLKLHKLTIDNVEKVLNKKKIFYVI